MTLSGTDTSNNYISKNTFKKTISNKDSKSKRNNNSDKYKQLDRILAACRESSNTFTLTEVNCISITSIRLN